MNVSIYLNKCRTVIDKLLEIFARDSQLGKPRDNLCYVTTEIFGLQSRRCLGAYSFIHNPYGNKPKNYKDLNVAP